MRKVTAFIFILLLLLALPVNVLAGSVSGPGTSTVTVTTVIPDAHTVTLDGSHVELSYGGTVGGVVTVPRHSEPQILLIPDPGYEVVQVFYGGEDITDSYKNGIVTLPKVWKDDVLTVVTQEGKPEKSYHLSGTVKTPGGSPIAGAVVTLHNPGSSVTTGSGGGFRFKDVPLGANTILVQLPDGSNETISLSVVRGSELSITYANGVYTVVLPQGAKGLKLDLVFDTRGGLNIGSGDAIWPAFSGSNPRTGDVIRLWILVLVISGTALLGAWYYYQKRMRK